MTSVWRRFKRVWSAEEIPPWVGLSVVAVIVSAVGVSSHLAAKGVLAGHETAQRDRSARAAFDLLVMTLSNVEPGDTAATQQALRAFSGAYGCSILRAVAADETVLASVNPDEIGRTRVPHAELGATAPAEAEERTIVLAAEQRACRVLRAPIPASADMADAKDPSGQAAAYVETALNAGVDEARVWTLGTVGTAMAAVCAFLVLHRLQRRHFRSMVRIAEHLVSHGDRIEEELAGLRLADTEGAVAVQWNRLVELMGTLQTERKRSDASTELMHALEKSKRGELADVVDVVPEGILYVVEGRFLAYANTAAKRLMGMESLPGSRTALEDLPVEATGKSIVERVRGALGEEGAFSAVSETLAIEGQETTYRLRVLPFGKRRDRGECVVMISDISQQVRAERASGEFVSQVTHELRTPLTNIRAYAETLSSGVFDDPKVVTECYNVITKETRRLSRLIEDILSMSQLEVGTIQLHLDDVDLRALLTDSVRDVRGLADEKRIDVQLSMPSKLPVPKGDRDKLAVVMNNLLGNALKYTAEGGQVLVSCQTKADAVLITVKDNGMGIEAADHEKIFEKFQRGTAPEVAGIQGTGIGLTTAREIARRHGGDIQVISERGQGATFIVHLPCAAAVSSYSGLGARE